MHNTYNLKEDELQQQKKCTSDMNVWIYFPFWSTTVADGLECIFFSS